MKSSPKPTHPFPLAALADTQYSALRTRFRSTLASLTGRHARRLAAFARRNGKLSINMRPQRFLDFLMRGDEPDYLSWVESRRRPDESLEDAFRQALGEWYEPRRDFQEQFGAQWQTRYGALNCGGLGTPHFGNYCSVHDLQFGALHGRLVWLAEDSASGKRFLRSETGTLDPRRMGDWVAVATESARLTALKLDPVSAESSGWPALICADGNYIEAVFIDGPRVEQLDEVRFSRSVARGLQERALLGVASATAGRDSQDLDLYDRIRSRLDELQIRWLEVDDTKTPTNP